ncbi:MAG: TonB family protein [Acidocella sp.]|nr:TonB family protein [Acidocella sp.]
MDDTLDTSPSRKLVGIAIVALLHVVIIYALVSGLGKAAVQVLRAPLQAQIIQDVKPPPEAPPPPPPPVITPPPPYIPPPLIQVAQPPPPSVIAQVATAKPPAPAPVARPAPSRAAGLDSSQSCAAPEYPEDAEDMGQTGTSVLQFLIGADGAVEQARVASSSGHGQLDQTALQALGRCKFKPALGADGKPVEAWTSIRYVWTLN